MAFPFTIMQTVEKEDIVCDFSVTEVLVTGMHSSESYHFHSFYELFTVLHGQMRITAEEISFSAVISPIFTTAVPQKPARNPPRSVRDPFFKVWDA